MPKPGYCMRHSLDGKSAYCFTLPIRCRNCGARTTCHWDYGKRIDPAKIEGRCEQCGCEAGWEIVRE